VGSTAGTSSTTIQSGSGAISLTTTNGALTANSGTGNLGVSTDATTTTVSLGTGAGVKTVLLGSTNSTSTTTIQCGSAQTMTIFGISGKTSASGVAVLVNSSNVMGTTTSSLRFKDNVQDMGSSSSDIYNLRPVTFNYKQHDNTVSEEDSALIQYGLIAEEVYEIMPELVSHNEDGEIESVRYLNLIPMLLNEIQKLKKEIDQLKGV
jgi:hypothetical protein